MPRYQRNMQGGCPYGLSDFDPLLTEERQEGQDLMFCNDCGYWSARNTQTGYQYPLDDPTDKNSPPAVSVVV